MRFMISPKRRPTVISMMSWARKTTSDAPLLPVSAASEGAVLSARTEAAQKQARAPSRAAAKIGVEQVMGEARGPSNPALSQLFPAAALSAMAGTWTLIGHKRERPCNCKLLARRISRAKVKFYHDPVVRAGRAIVPRLRISRTWLAAQPRHALAVGGFWLGVDAPARAVMEETP